MDSLAQAQTAVSWATQPAPGGNPDADDGDDDDPFTEYVNPKIYLFTEIVDGQKVVVGRVGTNDASVNPVADPNGTVAFVIYITPDGQEIWSQQFLAVDHGADGNDFDSRAFLTNDSLLLTAMATDFDNDMILTSQDISDRVGFEDDGPKLVVEEMVMGTVEEEHLNSTATNTPPHLSFRQ